MGLWEDENEKRRKWGNEKVRDCKCWPESEQLREEFLDFLRVAGRIGCHALAEGVDGRTEVVQLGVVDNHEAVVEVVGIGNRQPLVLLVELGDFGGRGLAAIAVGERRTPLNIAMPFSVNA